MNKRWTKLISVVCLVAMLIGLLPAVAVAAPGDKKDYTLDFASETANNAGDKTTETGGTDGYFTISYKSKSHLDAGRKDKSVDGYTFGTAFRFGGKSEPSKVTASGDIAGTISFTTNGANASVEIWMSNNSSGERTIAACTADGTTVGGTVGATKTEAHGTIQLTEADTYYLTCSNDVFIGKIVVHDVEPASTGGEETTPTVEVNKKEVTVTSGDETKNTATVQATVENPVEEGWIGIVYGVGADTVVEAAVSGDKSPYTVEIVAKDGVKEDTTVDVYVVAADTEVSTLDGLEEGQYAQITVTVKAAAVEDEPTYVAEGVYYFAAKNQDNDPYWDSTKKVWDYKTNSGTSPEVAGVTFGAEGWDYTNDHGPWVDNGVGGTITFNVNPEDVDNIQLVIITCGYGNGGDPSVDHGTVTAKEITGESAAAKIFTILPNAETVTVTFTSKAYIHGILVQAAEAEETLDTAALEEAIATAEETIKTPKVSVDGTDVGQKTDWVKQSDVDTLQKAIDAATKTLEDAKKADTTLTQDDIDAAITTLNTAVATFEKAYQKGSSTTAKNVYTITTDVQPEKGGTVKVDPQKAEEGTKVTVTITPAEGYEVKEYAATYKVGEDTKTITLTKGTTEGTYTFAMADADVTVAVTFQEAKKPDVPPVEEDAHSWIASEATLPAADAKSPVLLKDFDGLKAYATTGDKAFQLQTKASGKVYIQGDGNPKLSDGKTNPSVTAMPEVGAYYYFVATEDGTLAVDFFCGKGKNMFVTNGTTALEGYDGGVLDANNDTEGTFTIQIKAGETYYAFCTGSKLMVHKITFVPKGETVLTLEKTNVEVVIGETADVIYSVVGDTKAVSVTATSGDAKVATATVGDGKITITGVAEGSTTVTVTAKLEDGKELTKSIAVKVVGEEENPPAQDGTYTVTVDTVTHGTVTPDKTKDLKAGDKVTLTVKPDDGYKLDTLTVTGADGKAVDVTEADGKYTFVMPAGNVTVKATFVEDSQGGGGDVEPPVTTGTTWKFDATTDVAVDAKTVAAGEKFGNGKIEAFGSGLNVKTSNGAVAGIELPKAMKGGFKFTIPAGSIPATLEVVFASTGSDNQSWVGVYKGDTIESAVKVAEKDGKELTAKGTKDVPENHYIYENLQPGTYWVVCDSRQDPLNDGSPKDENLRAGRVISITVTFGDGGQTTEPTKNPPVLTLGGEAVTVEAGKSATVTATATNSGAITVASADATIATATFADGNVTITGVKEGTTTVTVTATNADGKDEKTIAVTVTAAGGDQPGPGGDEPTEPEEITISIDTSRITVRKTETLRYTLTPADAVYGTIYWVSDDTDILSVTTNGSATGMRTGRANVTAYVLKTAADGLAADNILAQATREIQVVSGTTYSGGGSSGGGTSASTSSKTNANGDTVRTQTNSNGDKTITVTDKSGNVLVTLQIPAQTPDLGYKFEDVPDNHWAEPSIQAMAAMKIFQGVSSTRHIFDMNSAVTRGTMAQILFNMSQGKTGMNNPFADSTDAWYTDAVAWAATVGVVTGVSDTNFAPNDSITREQLITMLYRYAQLLALDTNVTADMGKFVDADEIDSWASAAMTWAVGKGLIIGKGAGILDPKAAASRAEAAVIIDRFLMMVK